MSKSKAMIEPSELAVKIAKTIAAELEVRASQVMAAIQLLDAGDTVPFISRYRKEVTGGLSDTQLRNLVERLTYLRELEDRRATIIKSIEEQGKLSQELLTELQNTDSKARLEDLYLPYKPKRRTKGQIAKEAGLEPLAFELLQNPMLDPNTAANAYLNPEHQINDTKAALEGARFILMEHFSENAELLGKLRKDLNLEAKLSSKVIEEKKEEAQKFQDYFEYEESIQKIPSHRLLAVLRGRNEDFLKINIVCNHQNYEQQVAMFFGIQNLNRPADAWLQETARWAWKIKIFTHLESELMNNVKEKADEQAISVFAMNLRDLLMSAPAGPKVILGLDPGLRTGVKLAIIDATGKLLQEGTIYPHAPRDEWEESIKILAKLCEIFKVDLVSIGNGTASRETDALVNQLIKKHPQLKLSKLIVSEAGASVYSASELAAKEFPNLDVSIRGAVSIARRLQDPLAELVKIDPKSIGVGQYQHDVSQVKLSQSLDAVIEDCVNSVGVDANTASAPLLSRICGLNASIAKNIVEFRDQNGGFKTRQDLMQVSRLGPKAFEQAAGFLRIISGDNPLDASGVHPESYPVVEKILNKHGKSIKEVIGNKAFLQSIQPGDYTDEKFGIPTITDIIKELEKPGRDPRPEFKTANFNDSVNSIADLKTGMILEGVVSNVANFGAFVDLGVHQDGLIHISELSNQFITNPRDIIKTGDIVKVKVIDLDIQRKRISLSLRLEEKHIPNTNSNNQRSHTNIRSRTAPEQASAFAAALKGALNKTS
ncbi:MAG: Tex family protein [Gammaproteobacteria bacterium]